VASSTTKAADLVGTWRLVRWTADIDGRPVTPFGGETTGLITYTDDGRMWGTLMRVDRPHVEGDTLAAAPQAQRARAATGYLNYAGTYRVEGSTVIHSVEVSLFPNWIGSDQVREIKWVPNDKGGQDLVLSAQRTSSRGGAVTNRLVWRRLQDWD
jgi:hypothetical protein